MAGPSSPPLVQRRRSGGTRLEPVRIEQAGSGGGLEQKGVLPGLMEMGGLFDQTEDRGVGAGTQCERQNARCREARTPDPGFESVTQVLPQADRKTKSAHGVCLPWERSGG